MSTRHRLSSPRTARRASVAALAVALIVIAAGCGGRSPVAVLAGGKLIQERSGLLIGGDFRSGASIGSLDGDFELNGSAPAAHRRASIEADGLHVGVSEHRAGSWEGYFAVTRQAFPATAVFHVHMARPPVLVPSAEQSGEAVFAVQTGSTKKTGDINYVLVASLTTGGKTHWLVGYAEGHISDARTTVLWASPASASGDLAEDVSLRTNGSTSLEVTFGGTLVYSNHGLTMHIAPPFQAYLEVQSLGIAYDAVFQHLWAAADSRITVQGLLRGDEVTLQPAERQPIRASASARGEAQLQLAPASARGSGVLTIRRAQGQLLSTALDYTGGDVYRLAR